MYTGSTTYAEIAPPRPSGKASVSSSRNGSLTSPGGSRPDNSPGSSAKGDRRVLMRWERFVTASVATKLWKIRDWTIGQPLNCDYTLWVAEYGFSLFKNISYLYYWRYINITETVRTNVLLLYHTYNMPLIQQVVFCIIFDGRQVVALYKILITLRMCWINAIFEWWSVKLIYVNITRPQQSRWLFIVGLYTKFIWN